jgi:serine/threonine-protein kinase
VGTRLLDRYSTIDRIGSGGMASIYRATDERLDRVVCVKLLRTTLVDRADAQDGRSAVYRATYTHFLQEALALSKLQHANTLRIYDFGYMQGDSGDQGAPFHVSEYLDGGNLDSHVRTRGPLPHDELVRILNGICGAVDEAHEHGIIHRDIKPSNILFARIRGELVPKLADFGIAHSDVKLKSGPTDLSASVSAVALFSPRWAAPEQLCGSPEGPRTDVYALGLLTVFMLTGKVLFSDEHIRRTFDDRVRGDGLITSRLANLGLGAEVGRVVARALRASPDDRIGTAPELAQLVRQALEPRSSNAVIPPAASSRPSLDRLDQVSAPSTPMALQIEAVDGARPPPERTVPHGERRLRYVQVHERVDLSFLDGGGSQVRFRVAMLPAQQTSLNVKGLNCFVAKQGGRATPALTANQDLAVELVSAGRQILGTLSIHFGQATPNGRVFVLDGRQVLVTYPEAQQVIVLAPSRGQDIVVMCRS